MEAMHAIEAATKDFADARMELNAAVQRLQNEIARQSAMLMPEVKKRLAVVADRHVALNNLIAGHPSLFDKPRTVSFFGVKVGLQKGAGGIDWADADEVVARTEKLFRGDEDMLDILIITKKKPRKTGLETLDVDTLKKLGCTVENTVDAVVIKPADTAVDKIVRALLRSATEPSTEEEQEAVS